jgi:hypothetical protein
MCGLMGPRSGKQTSTPSYIVLVREAAFVAVSEITEVGSFTVILFKFNDKKFE